MKTPLHSECERLRKASIEDLTFPIIPSGSFLNKYGERFVMVSSDVIDEIKFYFYALVLNSSIFEDGHKKVRQGEYVLGKGYLESYQSIEILEDGRIRIIH